MISSPPCARQEENIGPNKNNEQPITQVYARHRGRSDRLRSDTVRPREMVCPSLGAATGRRHDHADSEGSERLPDGIVSTDVPGASMYETMSPGSDQSRYATIAPLPAMLTAGKHMPSCPAGRGAMVAYRD